MLIKVISSNRFDMQFTKQLVKVVVSITGRSCREPHFIPHMISRYLMKQDGSPFSYGPTALKATLIRGLVVLHCT
jgi:hypothetical protein